MIRCTSCNRPLKTAYKAIFGRGGMFAFGPVCARKAGLRDRERVKVVRARVSGTTWHDPAQMALALDVAA